MTSNQYTSDGFDLDAIPSSQGMKDDDIVFEIGGGATTLQTANETQAKDDKGPISKSEELKTRGNEYFKKGDFLNAYDYYADAIEACPGMTGDEIRQLKEDYEMNEREKANKRYLRETDRRRKPQSSKSDTDVSTKDDGGSKEGQKVENSAEDEFAPSEFEMPPHEFGKELAVYYSNRAACLLHENRYEDAINDCEIAILLNPKYTKAFIRRMTAYEQTEQTEEALRDAKAALELNPGNGEIHRHVKRLQKIEDERIEKLKEETMGKLKDLGNSILGNFGLSLDNFKAQQDPGTGSYNLSFQN
mmetsp:Transcript_8529/g.10784  ORF Transcript_8529/g.10784 Transcript_8529/m.10784 type:complete len:303 (-) Transcript_8529:142-1050(-)